MKFVLKNNLVYVVENYGIPNNNIEGAVEAPGFEDWTIEYKVNTGNFVPLKNGFAEILSKDLKQPVLNLTFRALKDEKIEYFRIDPIPLTHTVILGQKLEDAFPERFRHLEQRMSDLEKLFIEKEKTIDEALKETLDNVDKDLTETKESVDTTVENTTKTLNEIIKETVEVFEDITRKGSLF